MAKNARHKNIIYRGKRQTIKISPAKDKGPVAPLKLGGDPYTGSRELNKKDLRLLGFSLGALLEDLYINKKMSSYEISEYIADKYGLRYSYRWILMILKERGLTRSQKQSMKVRVQTGRMDYKKRAPKRNNKKRYLNWKYAVYLQVIMRKRKVSYQAIADVTGVSRSAVETWTYCRNRVSPRNQQKICSLLNCKNGDIFSSDIRI